MSRTREAACGAILGTVIVGLLWLAARPSDVCDHHGFGCLSVLLVLYVAAPMTIFVVGWVGAWLLRLRRSWLVALAGLATLLVDSETAMLAPGGILPWLLLCAGAGLVYAALAVVLSHGAAVRPRLASIAAAALGIATLALAVPLFQQEQRAETFSRLNLTLVVPEMQGFRVSSALAMPGDSGDDTLALTLEHPDDVRHTGPAVEAWVTRPRHMPGPCAFPESGLPLDPGQRCRALGPDRWMYDHDGRDHVVIRYDSSLVELEPVRGAAAPGAMAAATIHRVTASQLSRS